MGWDGFVRMRILLFAQLRKLAGAASLEVELPATFTLPELRDAVAAACPALGPQLGNSRAARNGEFAGAGTRFENRDEIALIPPVSGG